MSLTVELLVLASERLLLLDGLLVQVLELLELGEGGARLALGSLELDDELVDADLREG